MTNKPKIKSYKIKLKSEYLYKEYREGYFYIRSDIISDKRINSSYRIFLSYLIMLLSKNRTVYITENIKQELKKHFELNSDSYRHRIKRLLDINYLEKEYIN